VLRGKRWAGLVAAWILGLGCGRGPAPSAADELKEIQREGKELDASLDRLEDRFLADQSQVQLWEELKVRHQHVSALATATAHEHLVGMLRHYEHQEAKAAALRQGRLTLPRTVASAAVQAEPAPAPATPGATEESASSAGGGR
jgi:hypothetical protein